MSEKEAPEESKYELLTRDMIIDVEKQALNFSNPSFKVLYRKNAMQVDVEKGTSSGAKTIRVYATIKNVQPVDMFEMFLDCDYVGNYDTACAKWCVIGKHDEERSFTYYRSKTPFSLLFAPREFILTRICQKISDDKFVIYGRSIKGPHPPKPKAPKGTILGQTDFNFFLFLRDPRDQNATRFIYFTRAIPKGIVPSQVASWITGVLAPKMISKIRKCAPLWREWRKKRDLESKQKEDVEDKE